MAEQPLSPQLAPTSVPLREVQIPNASLAHYDFQQYNENTNIVKKCCIGYCKAKWASINFLLLVLNFVCFYATVVYFNRFTSRRAVDWEEILRNAGSAIGRRIKENYEVYRLFNPMFLHWNIIHLLSNCLGMVLFGFHCEARLGHIPFLIMYLCGGIAGNLFQVTIYYDEGAIGASSSVSALIGFMVVYYISRMTRTDFQWAGIVRVFILSALQLVIPQGNVGIYAHAGGLIIGLLVGVEKLQGTRKAYLLDYVFKLPIRIAVLILYVVLLFVFLFIQPISVTPSTLTVFLRVNFAS